MPLLSLRVLASNPSSSSNSKNLPLVSKSRVAGVTAPSLRGLEMPFLSMGLDTWKVPLTLYQENRAKLCEGMKVCPRTLNACLSIETMRSYRGVVLRCVFSP